MRLTPLLDRWTDDPAFAELLGGLDPRGDSPRPEVVVPDVARAFLLAGMAHAGGRLVVVTTATTADARPGADFAAFLAPTRRPPSAWETRPRAALAPLGDVAPLRRSTA